MSLELTQILAYMTALAIAAAIPGPGITALVARSVNSGAGAGFVMLFGLILGDLTYLSFAVFGLALLASSFSLLFVLVKWGALCYLCYLAYCFWTAEHQSLESQAEPKKKDYISAAISGYTITLGNPKTIAFYMALLPVVIDLELVNITTWAFVLVPSTMLVLLVVGAVFILAAMAVRQALSSKKAQTLLHRGAATTMLGAAASMFVREF
ncbi:lysine transporter LysE [Marinomonas sp. S3726]|uniref:LysE family translocator n=1 Tax=Marinomonas sp. S3726 TaxID=579484 RepID=UPI0005FA0F6D|nr:LysE family translocator [Marinomonas sp. S3726]KJZ13709.1 lysine transporter LysE [Marinomonas sp. S3726]